MVEAQFAQPFLVATALVHGRVGIAEVDGLGTPAVLGLSDQIAGDCPRSLYQGCGFPGTLTRKEGRNKGALSITVERADGRSVTIEATDPIGSPQKPLSDAQFEAKFRDCAGNAARPLSDARVDAALATIRQLEIAPDARDLIAPFAG